METLRRKFEQRYPLTPAAGPLRYLKVPIIPVFAKHTRRKLDVSRRADLVRLVLSAGVLPDSRC